MIEVCKKCGDEGHAQENCTLTGVTCYKCGKMGHIAGECTQMGRFALRHQIYDPPPPEMRPFCQQCKEEGHWMKDCNRSVIIPEREMGTSKYQEAYEDLHRKDPIASMDETATEYPSQEYRQIDLMIEDRRNLREQTPKRGLDKMNYQPRRLIKPDKIELGVPRDFWTLHKDSVPHEIYPIPGDKGERKTSHQQSSSGSHENMHWKERNHGSGKGSNPASNRSHGTGDSAGAPGGGGGGDEPSDPSVDEGLNRGEDVDSEEENEDSITSARLRGQRGRPGPIGR